MLAAAEGTQFSDGGEEDEEEEGEKLPYLNSLAAADSHGDPGLCSQSYVHTILRDSCSGPKEHEEEVVRDRSQSEYRVKGNAPAHLEQWLGARIQPTNLACRATRPFITFG
jgi:homeobox protein Nkx-2.3